MTIDELAAKIEEQRQTIERLSAQQDKLAELVAEHSEELAGVEDRIRQASLGFRNEPLPKNFFMMRGGIA